MNNVSDPAGGFTNMSVINTTLSIIINTTTPGPAPLPMTEPPVGYYGDIKEMLWKVVPPIIMVWGTAGNILTFLVLLRQMTKLSSTALYLMALAVSDTVVLFTGPLRQWLKNTWDYDVRYQSDGGCKVQVYITYASLHFSSWLLVAVTLERAFSVVLPHKVRIGCTPRNAALVIFSIFVFTYGINIFHLVVMGRNAYRGQHDCSPTTKEYLEFRDNIYQWFDFCIAFAVPFILLFAGNTVIIMYLRKSRAMQKAMSRGHTIPGRDSRSISVLMVALCVIFFVTMTPSSIFLVYYPYRFKQIYELFNTDPYTAWYDYQYLLFQHAIVNLIGYTNASFNFLLYVFSGTKFREQLFAMLRCRKSGTAVVFSSKQTTSSTRKTKSTIQPSMEQQHCSTIEPGVNLTEDVPTNMLSRECASSLTDDGQQSRNETHKQTN